MGKWHLCLRYPLWSSDHTPGMLCPPTESYQTNQLLLHRWTRRRDKTYAQISRAIGSLVEQPSLSSAESSYLFLCISVGKWHPQVQIRGDNVGTLFIRRFIWPFRVCPALFELSFDLIKTGIGRLGVELPRIRPVKLALFSPLFPLSLVTGAMEHKSEERTTTGIAYMSDGSSLA